MGVHATGVTSVLVVEVGNRRCAIPLEYVVETLRPPGVERLTGAPTFVRGVSVIRGAPVPVVDLGVLLDDASLLRSPQRLVTLRAGDRCVAVGVDRVVGVARLELAQVAELPPLLGEVEAVSAVGTSDRQLLMVLEASRIVPESVWQTLSRGVTA